MRPVIFSNKTNLSMYFLKNPWTYKESQESFEKPNTQPSLTQPNEALTVQDIVDRHTRGMNIGATLYRAPFNDEGANFDSDDLEKVGSVDLVEHEVFVQKQAQRVKDLESKVKQSAADEAASKDAAEQARIDKAIAARASKVDTGSSPDRLDRPGGAPSGA